MDLYVENQRLPKWILFLMLPGFLVGFVIVGSMLYVNGQKIEQGTGDIAQQNENWQALWIMLIVNVVSVLFYLWVALQTRVKSDGLYIRYFPFTKWRFFPKEKIEKIEMITYRPIGDVGGWGIGKSKKYGKVYSASGNKAVWLSLLDNTKILLGTQKPDVLLYALNKIL
jgi:hypothetical protein